MTTPSPRPFAALRAVAAASALCAAALISAPGAAWAQTTDAPSAKQMIEQLRAQPAAPAAPSVGATPGAPAAAGAPRTRSLRNLAIEAADPNAPAPGSASASAIAIAAPAPPPVRPSLSLLIQFDFNSARVRPESQQALANLAQALQSKELLASRFAVEGHTDAKGRADYNQKLSQQRADAVRELLAGQGVNADRLQAAGKGASELANNADPFAPENRRVRIVNLD